ncbi:hypothetical protein K2173_002776 [Erythroxylum novogranatense]|uniref:BHLH domain-containing protein n=1 Tax=Erythroxylum novogranatense TaxID=1862640 RepID=A0AAV8SQM0_9ROSI|nr:hypothetical protein K2173_002776 [Erythroxylum novogranatense]
MALLEALSSNDLSNFVIHDTISATPYTSYESLDSSLLIQNTLAKPQDHGGGVINISSSTSTTEQKRLIGPQPLDQNQTTLAVQSSKKRRRKARACKNKEEAETQRMTHITVERNRRKQMNEHLAVLKSLMPESYVQRGDQASIVGGAIEFVKELERQLQTLEAQKLQPLQGFRCSREDATTPLAKFFVFPQYNRSEMPNKYTSKSSSQVALADIEVTLIETHANLRILSRKKPRQLSKLVAGFQALYLTILHVNVTSMDPLVLCSISAKLEEGCQLTSADDIAAAVHHMLRIIEEEAVLS